MGRYNLPGLLALLALPATAHAFSLSPMSVSLEPSGKNATYAFTVDNNSTERLAVQVSMTGRKVDAAGNESNPDADEDFIVYPPQLVLEPNEKRTVRVTWAGTPKPERELAYRILAEQLPVDTAKPDKRQRALIRMLLRYLGAVYITPRGASPKIEVTSLERIEKKKKPLLVLTVENKGTAHEIVKTARLKIRAPGKDTLELEGDDLKALAGQNLLAGGTRRYELPWPAKLQKNQIALKGMKAELEIEN